MSSLIDRYVDRVLLYADKPQSKAQAIRQELKERLLQKVEDLAANGMPRAEAILEVLSQHGAPSVAGYRLRGRFPWIDIRAHGIARGFVAIGPKAIGIFAVGGWAIGIFAFGGLAVGVFALGGVCFEVFGAGFLTCGWPSASGMDAALAALVAVSILAVMEAPRGDGERVRSEVDRFVDDEVTPPPVKIDY